MAKDEKVDLIFLGEPAHDSRFYGDSNAKIVAVDKKNNEVSQFKVWCYRNRSSDTILASFFRAYFGSDKTAVKTVSKSSGIYRLVKKLSKHLCTSSVVYDPKIERWVDNPVTSISKRDFNKMIVYSVGMEKIKKIPLTRKKLEKEATSKDIENVALAMVKNWDKFIEVKAIDKVI